MIDLVEPGTGSMLLAAQQAEDWPVATGWRDWADEVGMIDDDHCTLVW